ncbi:polysaccharide/polyol phosphate ABC transporter ATP-binding protein [Ameyamaea chiangmaiensis NBRC 103196]|uniref:ABC transporter ATP-binding protein n=1 Tax=Ameyamaea chiangmaiensis TaxID=442969 RepID=A0A850P963_9PROT|nr:ABC transporter ATP-binding protein [Ameyamaea chiangmaiensis]MBS4074507.1 ABC transporter ATP-binding protein [Ameyamaea chiangmaiensis]NVN39229.1 ABC transporter ATP-binding protein [Ameyamaea chiangmaiensis]GBQ72299.1 polysaccharide/polyol phosphate ABC transporter ATP-binding protein [Ameyamaea chiangmaiensis NBRC 103196]
MASIDLRDASVEFKIYNARGRSLRNSLMQRVGGRIEGASGDHVCIRALDHITLSLRPGDRVALLGHNGAGKSTMLRLLSGVYEPSGGAADITGSVATLLDLSMGMDFEMTGRQNVILRAVFLGMKRAEARKLVPEIAAFSELGDYLDLPMRTYSSGMVLRLAFGVSTAIQPDIILMDEMISVGDAEFAVKARARLETMLSAARIFVLASHDLATLRQYCNRAIWLKEGRIVADGPIEDVLHRFEDRAAHGDQGALSGNVAHA